VLVHSVNWEYWEKIFYAAGSCQFSQSARTQQQHLHSASTNGSQSYEQNQRWVQGKIRLAIEGAKDVDLSAGYLRVLAGRADGQRWNEGLGISNDAGMAESRL